MSEEMKILVLESLMLRVTESVGTRMFRNLHARIAGKKRTVDIVEDGDKSCALFATSVLIGFGLVKTVHATVTGTIRDMETSGWVRISRPRYGCVVVWKVENKKASHLHIGFYVGKGRAISNSSERKSPQYHPYKAFKVHGLYWHPKLD